MKKTLIGALAVLFLAGFTAPAWAVRVAYVDVAEVFNQFQGTKDAKAKLKSEADQKRADLEKQQDELRKEMDDLQAQKGVLSKDKFLEKQQKLNQQVQKLQDKIQSVSQDLSDKEQQMTKVILDQIRSVIKDVAQDRKYDFVYDKNSLLYGGDDITYQVIQRLDNNNN